MSSLREVIKTQAEEIEALQSKLKALSTAGDSEVQTPSEACFLALTLNPPAGRFAGAGSLHTIRTPDVGRKAERDGEGAGGSACPS